MKLTGKFRHVYHKTCLSKPVLKLQVEVLMRSIHPPTMHPDKRTYAASWIDARPEHLLEIFGETK